MVTEQALRELLHANRWTLRDTQRTGKQKAFAASQRRGRKVVTKYIATEGRLARMSEADVLEKLGITPQRNEEAPEVEGNEG